MPEARFTVRLTRGAERDLRHLSDYIGSTRSREEATTLLRSIRDKARTLSSFPEGGAVPKELEALGRDEHRQLVLPPYRIFYQVTGDTVSIILIADGRRDIGALLQRRLLDS